MYTQDSINAKGISFDVFKGHVAECIDEAKNVFKNNFNTDVEPFVRSLGITSIAGVTYHLYESYVDSGSEDYFYFAVTE